MSVYSVVKIARMCNLSAFIPKVLSETFEYSCFNVQNYKHFISLIAQLQYQKVSYIPANLIIIENKNHRTQPRHNSVALAGPPEGNEQKTGSLFFNMR
jgi:hypothetical protein